MLFKTWGAAYSIPGAWLKSANVWCSLVGLKQTAGRELGEKTWEKSPWGVLAFTQRMWRQGASGGQALILCLTYVGPSTLMAPLYFAGLVYGCLLCAWGWCGGHGALGCPWSQPYTTSLVVLWWVCALVGETWYCWHQYHARLLVLPTDPAGLSLSLPMQGGTFLFYFPECIHCWKGYFSIFCANGKGQKSMKNSMSQISFPHFIISPLLKFSLAPSFFSRICSFIFWKI